MGDDARGYMLRWHMSGLDDEQLQKLQGDFEDAHAAGRASEREAMLQRIDDSMGGYYRLKIERHIKDFPGTEAGNG